MSAAQTVRDIIEASRYLVLATADAAGRPWSTPLYFAHIGFTEFYWVSSPDAAHSRNIAVRPEVGIAIFDSHAEIGAGQGVYVSATAELLEDGEIARAIEAFSRRSVAHGAREWTSQDVRPGAGLRLYRAGAGSHSILAKDGQPDHRISVPLTLWTATGSSRSTALTCAWILLATRPTRRSCSSAAWAARWTGGRRNSASGWRRAGDLSSGMTIVTPGGRSAIQPGRRGTRARTWRPMWSGCWTRSGGGALTWLVSRWAAPSLSRLRWLIPIALTRWY
jgi:nitroimidazol reductase NimA-like FMN-containing flavoprotein (pyridoxamine 5'-phosphate oxidase superfamily)